LALRLEHFRILEALHVHGPATIPALAKRLQLEATSVERHIHCLREKGFLVGDCERGAFKTYNLFWHRVERHPEIVSQVQKLMRQSRRAQRLSRFRELILSRSSVPV
jgi:DNA-binding IclR family transcriptional regulator